MTKDQANEAIRARIKGEYDNPQLLKFGALEPDIIETIKRIVQTYRNINDAGTGFAIDVKEQSI